MAKEKESLERVCIRRQGFESAASRPGKMRTYSWNGYMEFTHDFSKNGFRGNRGARACLELIWKYKAASIFQLQCNERLAGEMKVCLHDFRFQVSMVKKLKPWLNKPNMGILSRLVVFPWSILIRREWKHKGSGKDRKFECQLASNVHGAKELLAELHSTRSTNMPYLTWPFPLLLNSSIISRFLILKMLLF